MDFFIGLFSNIVMAFEFILLTFYGPKILDFSYMFCSAQEFCSVGDDSCLILWDARVGTGPTIKVIFLLIFASLIVIMITA